MNVAKLVTRKIFVALAVDANADAPLPSEFRLFTKGWNTTENGDFLFDDVAAASVVDAYEQWGVDLMIDLEHQSLVEGIPPDPTAKDARGWCRLELRNGELWAVGVTWTPDGAERLRQKRQRYISPAFGFEKDSRRVSAMVNVALTAMPATHDTPALIAANRRRPTDLRTLSAGTAFDEVRRSLQAALDQRFPAPAGDACGPMPWIVDVYDASVVYEHTGKLFEVPYTLAGSVATLGDPAVEVVRAYKPASEAAAPPAAPAAPAPAAEPAPAPPPVATNRNAMAKLAVAGGEMDPKLIGPAVDALKNNDQKKALEILESLLIASAGGEGDKPAGDKPADGEGDKPKEPPPPPPAGEPAKNAAEPPPAGDEEKKNEMLAAARFAIAITGKTNASEALAELKRRSDVAVDVEQREAKLAADNAAVEANERRTLVGALVKLRSELPTTAWADEKGTVPCERLAKEPIASLRDRVAKLSKAPGARQVDVTPPRSPNAGELTEQELAKCRAKNIDPAKYAETRAAIRANSAHKGV